MPVAAAKMVPVPPCTPMIASGTPMVPRMRSHFLARVALLTMPLCRRSAMTNSAISNTM